MATHSSVLAWRIPGMGEPGGLPSMGSHRVGHDWSDLAAEREKVEAVTDFLSLGSKITVDGNCGHEIKRLLLLGKKVMTNLDTIKKQTHHFASKGPSNQGYGFSSSHPWMWELDYKESWVQKNWCFWTMVLEKTLESPLDCKEVQPVHPKGNQSWMFIRRTDAEAETPILWAPDTKSWLTVKDLMLEKIEGRRRGQQRMRVWWHH